MYPRYAAQNVKKALTDTPVVFVMGPRQVGKTTLVRSLISEEWDYITLNDQAQLEIAKADPVGIRHQTRAMLSFPADSRLIPANPMFRIPCVA